MSLQRFYFLLCLCFVCILYRIVYYRSKAVLFCENSNLRENKPCMVQTIKMSAGNVFILWLNDRACDVSIPCERRFCFMCLRSTDLKHCHAPIRPAQMAFDIIALAYRVSPIASSAVNVGFE